MKKEIETAIKESMRAKESLLGTGVETMERAAEAMIGALKNGKKLLIFGNGGSAADSQHIAAELVGRFKMERRALPAIALTANTSILTAIGNDYGFDSVFSRQVEALGSKGDIALGISTSGKSKNVIEALIKAKSLGMITIALTGGSGGEMKGKADINVNVPVEGTPRIQEAHITIGHIWCELIEKGLFK